MINIAEGILPLKLPAGFKRDVSIDSCQLDADHYQVRGQLSDIRTDFLDVSKQYVVHCLVARITVNIRSNKIVEAEFSMPKMAFTGMCEQLPHGADLLVDLDITKGFSYKLRELYGGKRSCFHLSSLLQAMVPALTQCRAWNIDFKVLDNDLPPEKVPKAMNAMLKNVKNTCHAWEEGRGGIPTDFKEGHYDRMLDRVAPRLLGRWRQR